MSDGTVQVAPDSTGKIIDTSELTVGANTVERQRVVLADGTDPLGLATITNFPADTTMYGVVARLAGDLQPGANPVTPSYPYSAQFPGYSATNLSQSNAIAQSSVDTAGSLMVRGPTLTDEGSFRANFSGTTLSSPIGNVIASASQVSSTDASLYLGPYSIKPGEYFKVSADADTAYKQITSLSAMYLLLESNYVGTTSTTMTGARSVMKPIYSGSGSGITVGTGTTYQAATITSGTASGGLALLSRRVDYGPLMYKAMIAIPSQNANQFSWFGYQDGETSSPRWFARFRNTGSTTTIVCETGRNPTSAPNTTTETESYTVTYPNGLLSTADQEFQIHMLQDQVVFMISGIVVATCTKVIPGPSDVMYAVAGQNNAAATTAGSLRVTYIASKNFNSIDTAQNPAIPTLVKAAGLPTNGTSVSGTINALNGAVTYSALPTGTTSVKVFVAVTNGGTLATSSLSENVFQGTPDGTNWYNLTGVVQSQPFVVANTPPAPYSSCSVASYMGNTNYSATVDVNGCIGFRVYNTVFAASNSFAVSIVPSSSAIIPPVSAPALGSPVSLTSSGSPIAANGNIGPFKVPQGHNIARLAVPVNTLSAQMTASASFDGGNTFSKVPCWISGVGIPTLANVATTGAASGGIFCAAVAGATHFMFVVSLFASGTFTPTSISTGVFGPAEWPITGTATTSPTFATLTGTNPVAGTAAAATTIASAGNPIIMGGSDGTVSRALLTSTSGVLDAQITGATGTAMLPAAAASADALANPTITQIGAEGMLFNGTTWDRARGNVMFTMGDTGAKTATFNGATQTNFNARGAKIFVLIPTVTGTTPTLNAQLQISPDGGTTWINYGPASGNLTAAGNILIDVYPSNFTVAGATPAALTTGATQTVQINAPLPRTWRLVYTIGGTTPSFTLTNAYATYEM